MPLTSSLLIIFLFLDKAGQSKISTENVAGLNGIGKAVLLDQRLDTWHLIFLQNYGLSGF
jgi:hypothetical protein